MVQAKQVVRGISKQGRSKTYHRRGLWAIKKKHGGKFPQHEKKAKNEPAVKKVQTRSKLLDGLLADSAYLQLQIRPESWHLKKLGPCPLGVTPALITHLILLRQPHTLSAAHPSSDLHGNATGCHCILTKSQQQ